MTSPMRRQAVRYTLVTALALAPAPSPTVSAQGAVSVEVQFEDPPPGARPRVWWHWMNGNVTEDGIAKDIAWMKSAGIGGLQNFDAALTTPEVVPNRLAYMTPEWKKTFRFAAAEAERHGLELARPWIDYISRNSLMLQQGRYVADVAYFYGEEGPLTGLYEHEPVADAPFTTATTSSAPTLS